jgi:hypothetical protein
MYKEDHSGLVIQWIYDLWQYEVRWTCTWKRTVLDPLELITVKCPRCYKTRQNQRRDARSEYLLTDHVVEHRSAGDMMSQVKYFLHTKLRITGVPGMMTLVEYFQDMEQWMVGEPEECYL